MISYRRMGSLSHYVHLHRLRRCFPMSLLPCNSIASTCYSVLSILPTDNVPAPQWSEESEQRRKDPTVASSTSSTTFPYTDFTKERGKEDGFKGAYFLFE